MTQNSHELAIIGGDGIGPEVVAQGLRVLDVVEQRHGFTTARTDYDLGGRRYLDTGEVLSDDTLADLDRADAIYLGAIGTPDVLPGVLERGMLLKLRFTFDQFVNHRPVKLYPGVVSPIAGLTPDRCDFVVIRENTESVYAGAGGTLHRGTAAEVATQESLNTRHGVERVVRHAFGLADARPHRHLTLCHKTNVLVHAGDLWWRTFHEVGEEYPEVERDYVHVDAACLYFVTQPERFDVVVTENLFGDIITDLGAAVQGGMGLATSGNLDPTGTHPSMFEPVHGSAPDIAGTGAADPTAAVLALALLLESLGESAAAADVESAVAAFLAEREDGAAAGGHTTTAVGDRLVELVRG